MLTRIPLRRDRNPFCSAVDRSSTRRPPTTCKKVVPILNVPHPRRYRSRASLKLRTMSLAASQFWSPIGLGDRLRERTSTDIAARIYTHLEHGALYYYYSPAVPLAAPNLSAYMYPITPLRLRDGTILAQERILTSRSGQFGWNDRSVHEVIIDRWPGGMDVRAASTRMGHAGRSRLALENCSDPKKYPDPRRRHRPSPIPLRLVNKCALPRRLIETSWANRLGCSCPVAQFCAHSNARPSSGLAAHEARPFPAPIRQRPDVGLVCWLSTRRWSR